jgi:glycosyltransferase involved in cell wall biosynthesis
VRDKIILKIEYVPDAETEIYFKAADILILPYTHIFQSGVLFLGYNFGLPAIAADVGSLKEEIVVGQTGYIFQPRDTADLTRAIENYFASDLYLHLAGHRPRIREFALERYSWSKVARITTEVYARLLK